MLAASSSYRLASGDPETMPRFAFGLHSSAKARRGGDAFLERLPRIFTNF
jgi:hypothetical protein